MELPVPFVVGLPRSGTTLLRLMLDSHPDLTIPPESQFIPDAARAWREQDDPLAAALAAMTNHRCWGDLEIDAAELHERLVASPPASVGDLVRAVFTLIAEREGKPRWGEKSSNHTPHMQLISEILPAAHFVHIIRDGRDVFLSLRDLWFGPNTPEQGARWWRNTISRARRDPPANYLEVRYEDLVTAPAATLRDICKFLELPWDPSMLRYHDRAQERIEPVRRDVTVAGEVIEGARRVALSQRTTQPPDESRIFRWRTLMSTEERSQFEAIAGPLLAELRYPLR